VVVAAEATEQQPRARLPPQECRLVLGGRDRSRIATLGCANKKVGPGIKLTREQEARIRELDAKGGKSGTVRAIARTVGVPKGRVERFLQREKLSRNP
jgi:DNA invertase Pin-like site-specific DNA recombinase